MGCSYTGVCHTCNVKTRLPYSTYRTWNRLPANSDVVYMLHKFATLHAGHETCVLNDDWWCVCSDKHTDGMDSEDWSEVDGKWADSHESEIPEFANTDIMANLNTCVGYEEVCRCYGP